MKDSAEYWEEPQHNLRRSLFTCRVEAATGDEVIAFCINDEPGETDRLVTWRRTDLPLDDEDLEPGQHFWWDAQKTRTLKPGEPADETMFGPYPPEVLSEQDIAEAYREADRLFDEED